MDYIAHPRTENCFATIPRTQALDADQHVLGNHSPKQNDQLDCFQRPFSRSATRGSVQRPPEPAGNARMRAPQRSARPAADPPNTFVRVRRTRRGAGHSLPCEGAASLSRRSPTVRDPRSQRLGILAAGHNSQVTGGSIGRMASSHAVLTLVVGILPSPDTAGAGRLTLPYLRGRIPSTYLCEKCPAEGRQAI